MSKYRGYCFAGGGNVSRRTRHVGLRVSLYWMTRKVHVDVDAYVGMFTHAVADSMILDDERKSFVFPLTTLIASAQKELSVCDLPEVAWRTWSGA